MKNEETLITFPENYVLTPDEYYDLLSRSSMLEALYYGGYDYMDYSLEFKTEELSYWVDTHLKAKDKWIMSDKLNPTQVTH